MADLKVSLSGFRWLMGVAILAVTANVLAYIFAMPAVHATVAAITGGLNPPANITVHRGHVLVSIAGLRAICSNTALAAWRKGDPV